MNFLMKFFTWILRLVSLAFVIFIIVCIVTYFKPYMGDVKDYPLLVWAFHWESEIAQFVGRQIHRVMPTVIGGIDIVRPIMILLAIIIIGQLRSLREYIEFHEYTPKRYKAEFEQLIKATSLPENSKEITSLKKDLEEMAGAKGKKRKELILHFMEVKSKLEMYEQVLAFLSVDVVGSTAMKKTENPMVISADFYNYNEMADRILTDNGVIKVAKTPDGIMAAFRNTDHAVNAAQQLINELDHFNKFVKKMKTDFQIRCGINTGMIYFDPEEPLEHISDRVIDIAGHMQKEADPNTINIAKAAIAPLEKTGGFTTTEKLIDEQVVYTWKPK